MFFVLATVRLCCFLHLLSTLWWMRLRHLCKCLDGRGWWWGKTESCSGGGLPAMQETWVQYSCLENSMDRGAWWATLCYHGVAKSQTWLNKFPFLFLEGRALLSKALIQLSADGWGCTTSLVVVCLRLYYRVNGEFLENLHQRGPSSFCGEPLLTYTSWGRPSNTSR